MKRVPTNPASLITYPPEDHPQPHHQHQQLEQYQQHQHSSYNDVPCNKSDLASSVVGRTVEASSRDHCDNDDNDQDYEDSYRPLTATGVRDGLTTTCLAKQVLSPVVKPILNLPTKSDNLQSKRLNYTPFV